MRGARHDLRSRAWKGNELHRKPVIGMLYVAATLVGVLGAAVVAWALAESVQSGPSSAELMLFCVLLVATSICARYPLRFGVSDSIVMIDSIPLVLSAILLPVPAAVLLIAVTTIVTLIGQPRLPGVLGWYWRSQSIFASCVAMAAAAWVAHVVLAGSNGSQAVLMIEAFLIALVLEFLLDAFVVIELEVEHRGEGVRAIRSWIPLAANVILPATAAAMLTPYVDDAVWKFALLLPILLFGMYGALWVANSQQLEKRRGDRLKDTFSRYIPEGIVDDNLASMQQIELGGEQRELSVLFCDIRGFTSWSEDKGATEVITELNVLLSALSASVMATGGTLDKFTGDGLMAFWGAPVTVPDHAERACLTALDMLRRLDEVNARRVEEGQEPFAIGVAVHTGEAVVGNVGHERRLEYTAIGDTVNTAARLEAATKEIGAVLLTSRATVDALREPLRSSAMRMGDVTMKGKAHAVEAWALRPPQPAAGSGDLDELAA